MEDTKVLVRKKNKSPKEKGGLSSLKFPSLGNLHRSFSKKKKREQEINTYMYHLHVCI